MYNDLIDREINKFLGLVSDLEIDDNKKDVIKELLERIWINICNVKKIWKDGINEGLSRSISYLKVFNIEECLKELKSVWILSYGYSIWCCTFNINTSMALGMLQKGYLGIGIAFVHVNHSREPFTEYILEFPHLQKSSREERKILGCKLYELVMSREIQVEPNETTKVVEEILLSLPSITRDTNISNTLKKQGQKYATFKLVKKTSGKEDTEKIGEAIRNIYNDRSTKISRTFKKFTQSFTSSILRTFKHGFSLQDGVGICNVDDVKELEDIARTVLTHTDWETYKIHIKFSDSDKTVILSLNTFKKPYDIDMSPLKISSLSSLHEDIDNMEEVRRTIEWINQP